MSGKRSFGRFFTENAVVIIFLLITMLAIKPSGLSITYIVQEMLTRLGRNCFLVLALLLPIYAGMGLNFGMTLGAMAGQIGLIFAINWNIMGVAGIAFAALLGTPLAVFMGWICGVVLNKAKGREMVTGYILAYFVNGIYQFVVLYLMGVIIPIRSPAILLSRGYGIRNTLNLDTVRQSLDNLLMLHAGPFGLPMATYLVIAVLCLFVVWFKRTKLGQDMRAVGYNMAVADMDGDGKADPTIYQASTGSWIVLLSRSAYALALLDPGFLGSEGYVGMAADFDSDGFADPAVAQASTGNWKVKLSSGGYSLVELNSFLGE